MHIENGGPEVNLIPLHVRLENISEITLKKTAWLEQHSSPTCETFLKNRTAVNSRHYASIAAEVPIS